MPSLGSYLLPAFNNTGVVLRSYAHASRLYGDNVLALSPKTAWIHYTVFDINPACVIDKNWLPREQTNEVGMLVKGADLPKFQIDTEVVNQYNRKTVIQKKITYQPVNLSLHDDHSNLTHNMWLNYFRYYFVDSTLGGTGPIGTAQDNSTGAYGNTKYSPPNSLINPTNYGLNSQLVKDPFFRSITIYQLNKKIFTSYQLINPIIKSWEHDRVDQSQGGKVAESKMSVEYETVFYGTGQVQTDTPSGFAVFHYDHTPSPLGTGFDAADIFGDVTGLSNPGSTTGPLDFLNSLLNPSVLNNITGNARGNNSLGYSILSGLTQTQGTGGFNGLGIDLNINKGNNYVTAGQSIANPISLISGFASGQEPNISGVTTQSVFSNGVIPTSTNPGDVGAANLQQLSQIQNILSNSQFTPLSIDNTPSGTSVASGHYFSIPKPLSDSSPYTASSFVTGNSSLTDIQGALSGLNTSWATDNDFVNSQTVDPSLVSSTLANAASPAEFSAIQSEASLNLTTVQNLQTTVDGKYQPESDRLNSLLTTSQTDVSGSPSLDTTLDLSPTTPSIESLDNPDFGS